MAQVRNYNIEDGSGRVVLDDLNTVLGAIHSTNSDNSPPVSAETGTLWYNTGNYNYQGNTLVPGLYVYDSSNDWVTVRTGDPLTAGIFGGIEVSGTTGAFIPRITVGTNGGITAVSEERLRTAFSFNSGRSARAASTMGMFPIVNAAAGEDIDITGTPLLGQLMTIHWPANANPPSLHFDRSSSFPRGYDVSTDAVSGNAGGTPNRIAHRFMTAEWNGTTWIVSFG